MIRRFFLATAVAAGLAATPAGAVTRTETTINGLKVLLFEWTDSNGLKRSVALKREGLGNPGHGGYAVQMVYRYRVGAAVRTITANPGAAGEGFGYFVSHERYRLFSDGKSAPIANKIFHVDDSPLGRGFAVTTSEPAAAPGMKTVRFSLVYRHYGTIAPGAIDPDTGDDAPPLGLSRTLYRNYDLPVVITWAFQDGRDFPRILTEVSLAKVVGGDRVSFDLRGPYGKLDFDAGDNPIARVRWGDRYHFTSTQAPLTRDSAWTWSGRNFGARYSSLTAGVFEMGLIEPRPFSKSLTNDGYADGRGKTSATYFRGKGCPFEKQLIPCDYEWPYQSAQYELPYDDPDGTTTSEKMAWGSTPYYGTRLNATYDGVASTRFNGFPSSRRLAYDVCVVVGRTVPGGLTRSVALEGGDYRCADAPAQ